eukprot:s3266_g3.t1
MHAALWTSSGEIRTDTVFYTDEYEKYGNNNGCFVKEAYTPGKWEGLGSWQRSAVSAKIYLEAELRTYGRHL